MRVVLLSAARCHNPLDTGTQGETSCMSELSRATHVACRFLRLWQLGLWSSRAGSCAKDSYAKATWVRTTLMMTTLQALV